MIDNNQNGRQGREGAPEPDDQSLDRGYGGLPGKQAGEELDDDNTVTKKPAKAKVRPRGRQPEATKH
jgi:hypothetical protein